MTTMPAINDVAVCYAAIEAYEASQARDKNGRWTESTARSTAEYANDASQRANESGSYSKHQHAAIAHHTAAKIHRSIGEFGKQQKRKDAGEFLKHAKEHEQLRDVHIEKMQATSNFRSRFIEKSKKKKVLWYIGTSVALRPVGAITLGSIHRSAVKQKRRAEYLKSAYKKPAKDDD